EDGNEDQIVDAENDFQHDQRQKRYPGRWISEPHEMRREKFDDWHDIVPWARGGIGFGQVGALLADVNVNSRRKGKFLRGGARAGMALSFRPDQCDLKCLRPLRTGSPVPWRPRNASSAPWRESGSAVLPCPCRGKNRNPRTFPHRS